jgi:GntR family transcriptional regulator
VSKRKGRALITSSYPEMPLDKVCYNCTSSISTIVKDAMQIRIDPESTVPIYMQIVHVVKQQVATGRLSGGTQLPTVREMATILRINPNTVARAYDQLDSDGVITTQQGRGTFVREHPDNVHLARVRQEQLKALVDGAIGKALSTGYDIDQVREMFDGQLAWWSKQKKS